MRKNYIFLVLLSFFIFLLSACGNKETITTTKPKEESKYYDDSYENPLKDLDMGGYDILTLDDSQNITLENENVRLIIDKNTGGIVELANKEAHVYLVKNGSSIPLEYYFIGDDNVYNTYESFSYDIVQDDDKAKSISLSWKIDDRA